MSWIKVTSQFTIKYLEIIQKSKKKLNFSKITPSIKFLKFTTLDTYCSRQSSNVENFLAQLYPHTTASLHVWIKLEIFNGIVAAAYNAMKAFFFSHRQLYFHFHSFALVSGRTMTFICIIWIRCLPFLSIFHKVTAVMILISYLISIWSALQWKKSFQNLSQDWLQQYSVIFKCVYEEKSYISIILEMEMRKVEIFPFSVLIFSKYKFEAYCNIVCNM